jgi:hypothetical protein
LTWWEEPGWCWSWGGVSQKWELGRLGRDDAAGGAGVGNWKWGRLGTDLGLGLSKRKLVASVEGVDEGVESFASGAWGNIVGSKDTGNLWGEFGAVLVEGKVAVGGVVWVDEGVVVLGNWGLDKLLPWGGSWGRLWLLLLLNSWGNLWPWCWSFELEGLFIEDLLYKWGGVDAGGWNVSALQDPESFFAGRVLDSVGFAVSADVGVLTDPVSRAVGLLSEDDLVLGCESGSGAAVAGVEPLFLEDLGVLLFNDLGEPSREDAG